MAWPFWSSALALYELYDQVTHDPTRLATNR